MISCVVVQGKKVDVDYAKRVAVKFNVEVAKEIPEDKYACYFLMDKTGISYVSKELTLKGDFERLLPRVTNGHLQHELLMKVVKSDIPLKIVDCTAGLGEDSFIMAACGNEVMLFEHNPITAVLLNDALIRARNHPGLKEIAKRMTFREGDSKELLGSLGYVPDMIYLDPMFPKKEKNSESKKKLQVLHTIEAPCSDEKELVEAALASNAKKIIIKRPPDGPYLADIKPSYSIERKAVRFDCIVVSD